MNQHYDVIIIGSGAGGGTLASRLAGSGKRILIVERGDYVAREKANWASRAVAVEARYHTRDVWRDREGRALHPHTSYNVGGNTKFYGAAVPHARQDFRRWRTTGVSRRGRSATASSPTTPGRAPVQCTASAGGSDRAVGERLSLSCLTDRASSSCDDLAGAGLRPFHVPLAVSGRATRARPLHPVRHLRRLPACCTRRAMRVMG